MLEVFTEEDVFVYDILSAHAARFDFLLLDSIVRREEPSALSSDPLSSSVQYDRFESVHHFLDRVDRFASLGMPVGYLIFRDGLMFSGRQVLPFVQGRTDRLERFA